MPWASRPVVLARARLPSRTDAVTRSDNLTDPRTSFSQDEMSDKYRMIFNRMRQAAITNDLVDIITGANAL